jgi:hypothetical protein
LLPCLLEIRSGQIAILVLLLFRQSLPSISWGKKKLACGKCEPRLKAIPIKPYNKVN